MNNSGGNPAEPDFYWVLGMGFEGLSFRFAKSPYHQSCLRMTASSYNIFVVVRTLSAGKD